MNTWELKCFQAAYENKSLTNAAKELFISTQGISRIIHKLEKELETTLFHRSSKGLKSTESGNILYKRANELIRQFEIIQYEIQQVDEKEGSLKIYCARGVLNALSFDIISDFIENHSDLKVIWKEASNEEVKRAITMSIADIGLALGKSEHTDIYEELIRQRNLNILVYENHPFFHREYIDLHELEREKLITLSEEYHCYHVFLNACKKSNMVPNIVCKTEDIHFLYKLCKQKNGLGIILDFSTDGLDMTNVKLIPLKKEINWDIFFICQKRNKSFPNIIMFLNYIKAKLYKDQI